MYKYTYDAEYTERIPKDIVAEIMTFYGLLKISNGKEKELLVFV